MSGVESNPPVPQESKSAKKKKAKAEAAAKDTTVQPNLKTEATKSNDENTTNGADGSYESPYVKELHKWVKVVIPKGCMTDDMTGASAMSRRSW